ncbi:YHS domain protein [Thalassococcus sp. CAU 1522]|uniref:YHS domain protein n=1 Tax=Thalassococcus arenae TaxID=2851652 RepID=A0ABS6N8V6_9RHOB|nr:YHS domain-containing (seleno)protein [Thalassococcus arenae]MBV2360039.1 YHS domain protein [Thalassococcus arenae]
MTTRLTRRAALGLLAVPPVLIAAGTPVLAMEPETFQTDGIAINGIDPVAYFTDAAPVAGSPDHSVDHNGATWRFVSADNAAAFQADPEKYGARFGGYCAYAASLGYLAPTQPEAWTVYEDRLYLNANLRARELWLQDVPGNIVKGEANWPAILG